MLLAQVLSVPHHTVHYPENTCSGGPQIYSFVSFLVKTTVLQSDLVFYVTSNFSRVFPSCLDCGELTTVHYTASDCPGVIPEPGYGKRFLRG